MLYRLDADGQTLVAHQPPKGLGCVLYWGAALPQDEDLTALLDGTAMDVTGGMMDEIAPLSVCPEVARGWPGQPGMILHDDAGRPVYPVFSGEIRQEVAQGSGARGLVIIGIDVDQGITYRAQFQLRAGQLLAQAFLSFDKAPYVVNWLAAPVVPMPTGSDAVIDYTGRWIGEFQEQRHAWRPGALLREARQGRSGHEHPPFALVTTHGASWDQGTTYGFALHHCGGHRMIAEELPDGRHLLMFGSAIGAQDRPEANVKTPPLHMFFSQEGRNGIACQFQSYIRNQPGPQSMRQPRPVHYNCWEAIYFDHDAQSLRDIAERAAALGAERFVLDDGWFGLRDDDTTSLGDWQIDPRKWPDGLRPFANYVNSLGMGFGLWFEPEMVNKDSALYRAHPDWLLGPADQPAGRQQYVLDVSRADVRAYLVEEISKVLASAPIEYVKWDHNRLLPWPSAAQEEGAYQLWHDLTTRHPEIEFESCASGGGRIDLQMFTVAGRVWLSDSNDALERMRIQRDAAQFLPWEVTGSHVGPRRCHTSGRVLDMSTRAWVAAQRHMGFEMDPRELTEDEADVLKQVTQWWKSNRDWRAGADILRLENGDAAVIAEQQIAANGHRFVVFAGRHAASEQIAPRPLPLTGLDPQARYRITLVNRAEAPTLSRGTQAIKTGPLILSGAWLMEHGVNLPWSFPATIWVLEGTRIDE